jgi:cytoskeleton protein RodZ
VPGAGPGGQTLTLHFSGGSWVQVADARGRLLLEGMQPAGSSRSVSGPAPLRVVLGNAPQVALEVGGRPASLTGLVRRRGDAHFQVDAGGTLSADAAHTARGD